MTVRIEITVSDEFAERLDVVRGLVPRAAFIRDALWNGPLAPRTPLGSVPHDSTPQVDRPLMSSTGHHHDPGFVFPAPDRVSEEGSSGFDAREAALERQQRMNKAKGL
jgi:hypothetical protein